MAKRNEKVVRPELAKALNSIFEIVKKRVSIQEIVDFVASFLNGPTELRKIILKELIEINQSSNIANKKVEIYLKKYANVKDEGTPELHKALSDIYTKALESSDNKYIPVNMTIAHTLTVTTLNSNVIEDFLAILTGSEEGLDDIICWGFIDKLMFNPEFLDIYLKYYHFIAMLLNMTDEQENRIARYLALLSGKNEFDKYKDAKQEIEDIINKYNKATEEKKKISEELKERKKELKELKKQNQEISSEHESKYLLELEEKNTTITELENYTKKLENDLSEVNSINNSLKLELEELENQNNKAIQFYVDDKNNVINEYEFVESVKYNLALKGLCYDADDIYNFHISVKSSPLTILAGVSGLGKTRLPLAYAECINAKEEDSTLLFLPISPSYTEPSDILGFYNSVSGKYQPAGTGFVDFLLHADRNPDKMHMVIFDEMNLSQIEYWFAPFMSILERVPEERILNLYPKAFKDDNYPSSIRIRENIIFVGTINLDETTKDMSDRLIDRAIVINLKKQSFTDFYNQEKPKKNKVLLCDTFDKFNSMKNVFNDNYIKILTEREVALLDELHLMIQKNNSSKGVSFRNVYKICNYLMESPNDDNFSRTLAFDLIFKQTILKKLNGYDASISKILGKLDDDGNIVDSLLVDILNEYEDISDFTNTKKDIKNKIKELDNYGFTR